MSGQARWVLIAAIAALAVGWIGLRRGNAALEARLAAAPEARP